MAERRVFETGCIVVGAGVIGLAIARRLAMGGRDVIVLERAMAVGTETSSRSNEVIHAGIYHRPGGPQAILCGRGREQMYEYCSEHHVEHQQIGKLVVATDRESVGWLEEMYARGISNEVRGLSLLSAAEASKLEPNLRCHAALHSTRTGIVDTHGLLLSFRGDAESKGAAIALNSAFVAAQRAKNGFMVDVCSGEGERIQIASAILINAAGIWAPEVARAIEGLSLSLVPRIYLAKGAFFTLRGPTPFRHLVVPEPKSWRQGGIFTLNLGYRGRFGPDEEWVSAVDYDLEGWPIEHIYAVVRRYFPALPDHSLSLDYAGIRPRLNGPGMAPADWLFQGEHEHGLPGLINLFGIESPGITASLAIADVVAGMIEGCVLPFEVDPSQYGAYQPPELKSNAISPDG